MLFNFQTVTTQGSLEHALKVMGQVTFVYQTLSISSLQCIYVVKAQDIYIIVQHLVKSIILANQNAFKLFVECLLRRNLHDSIL